MSEKKSLLLRIAEFRAAASERPMPRGQNSEFERRLFEILEALARAQQGTD